MTRYAWLIDTTKCIGCQTCTIACKDQFVDNDWPPYSAAQPDAMVDSTGWLTKVRAFLDVPGPYREGVG